MPSSPQQPQARRFSSVLTSLSHLPTPFITTFLLIHLSAPVLANFEGSSLSSQVMLLGREYYQGTFSEPWLVFAPLGVHVAAGITKRLLSAAPLPRRPSLLTLTAYPLLIFLPIHVMTHRLNPSSNGFPILSLSPSELDYEFVKVGLARWPIRSWVLYTGLVLCGLIHAFEGWNVVLRTWGSGGLKKTSRRVFAGAGIGVVLAGVIHVAMEPILVMKSTLTRINASYISSFVYRL
ncbi:hypothetical protein BU17DRAFT_73803 [Hysterangium stoloniferum]|nr:hypothetical protein BU17DRAFT_73803 [Hysterangium stoloniferum]